MDLVVFKRDVSYYDDPINVVFKEGKEYEILSEDNTFIYVNTKPKTTQCSRIPKSEEGILFEYV
ncbi:hypothetical protein FDG96_gp46 [Bacillus phage Mgbh1]|uniref:Uncharacterized protein n=1 Tax=Bacillus phage Mgbh1 TaxID=1796993 RepID=A0A142F1P8_9CAUD|nr:hypothetical protein FDG96_gp46 [Bacillus phage Mgbh1]AMQ66705.1 hypothetical protein [Bacillus phage Mgbh1]